MTLAGTGCSSGGGSLAPILGLVIFALLRMRKRRGIAVAAVLSVAGRLPAVPAPAPAPVAALPAAVALPVPEPTPAPEPIETVRDGKVVLLAPAQFETAKAVLLAQSLPILDKVVKAFNENPNFDDVRIEGYTDNAGSAKRNIKLSQARAEAVRGYLIANGISPYILTVKGYGAEHPVASNATSGGRAQNRRVELVTSEKSARKSAALNRRTVGSAGPPRH
jgi:uncharacterized protein (TIGR03382 family)